LLLTAIRGNNGGGIATKRQPKGDHMKNPLDSLWGTIISGLVLTLVLYYVVKLLLGS
jgi:hypothetical protein